MGKAADYGKAVLVRTFRKYAWLRDVAFGACVNLATLLLSVYTNLISKSDWAKNWRLLILVIVAPYSVAIVVHVMWKIRGSVIALHYESKDLIDRLNLKLASQVVVTEIKDGDPVIVAEFKDERAYESRTASIILTNRSSATAKMVRILPIPLRSRTVMFPYVAESVSPGASERFMPEVGDQWGYDSHADFVRALSENWIDADQKEIREITTPMRVDYEDEKGVKFEACLEIWFKGGYASYNPSHEKFIECRPATYRRIPTGTTPL
jgi:hypothetical protein